MRYQQTPQCEDGRQHGLSLLLLTLVMTVWRSFYLDNCTAQSAQRLLTRHRVWLGFFLPNYYREKIRSVPGGVVVALMTWFGGQFMNDKPENFFAQSAPPQKKS